MPRNIMTALNRTPDGKAPKNGFDLMSFETFHQKGGQFNVVGVRDTVPNSDYRMSVDGFTRTIINNTANFARIKENYYFVHVPLGLISRASYQTLVQRKESYSALDFGIDKFPSFDLKTVLKRLVEVCNMTDADAAAAGMLDIHGFNIGFGALKLFDMLGYGSYQDLVESTRLSEGGLTVSQVKAIIDNFADFKPTANRLAAYQCVWYHFFRNDIYDCEVTAKCFNFDDVTQQSFGGTPSSNYNILSVRSVDSFIQDCCQLRYVPYKKDLFMGGMPGTQFGAVSTVPISVDFSDLSASFTGTAVTPTGSFTGTAVTPSGSVSSSFNGDTSNVTAEGTSDYDSHKFLRDSDDAEVNPTAGSSLKYTTFKKADLSRKYDYLASVPFVTDPDLQMQVQGAASILQDSGYDIADRHNHHVIVEGSTVPVGSVSSSFSGNSFTPSGSISINSITPSGTVNLSGTATSSSLLDVLSLVEAQAIQKWRQKSMLAGNRTTAQFKAHHGVVPEHLIDHLPDFIGSVDNEIHITEITSQADTASSNDESNLGQIAGRGYGASDARTFNFHSNDYGILLLIHAIVPENTYSSYGLDPGNTMISYSDYFQSEYMNLGLRAVPNFILNAHDYNAVVSPSGEGEGTQTFTDDLGILSYAPAYFGYKQYPSKVHGFFNPSRLAAYGFTPNNKFGYADMQSFVLTRSDMVADIYSTARFSAFKMTLSNLYVNPRIFDSIFAVDADDSEVTDEFFSHVKFTCDALLPMSVLGLPQF